VASEKGDAVVKYSTTVGDKTFVIDVNRENEVTVDGEVVPLNMISIDQATAYSLLLDHDSYEVLVDEESDDYQVLLGGHLFTAHVEDERARRLAQASRGFVPSSGEIQIKAPMPGLIVAIPVTEEQLVKKGDVLVVLESMKMENELKAPRDGSVSAVRVTRRQNVEQNQTLVVLS
jgi:biotin carboxyl carrier protein